MGRITKAISKETVAACKLELKTQGIRGENGRRLQAIISASEHGISAVAKIYNISRETLMRWIHRFKEEGSKAFNVKQGRGRRHKLNDGQRLELQDYIEKEGKHLTAKKLRLVIKEKYGMEVSDVTAYRLLKKTELLTYKAKTDSL